MTSKAVQSVLLTTMLVLFQIEATCADNLPMTKLGNFSPYKEFPNAHQIWICAENGKVNVSVGGSESYVMTSCPENWLLQESRVVPAYIFKEQHGIKIRFTQPAMQPKEIYYDIHIYYSGKYYKVGREFLKPLLESSDETKLAEIKDQVLWFDNQKLGRLPEQSTSGIWYPSPLDLEVILADDFHDELTLTLNDHSEGILSNWRGKALQLRLDDHAIVTTGALSLSWFRILANLSSTVDVHSVNCDKLDASAQNKSVVTINAGHIVEASTGEAFGGKVLVSAQVDKLDGQSTGITNSQKIIKKLTPQGTILEFPKYGNFELK